MCWYCFGNINVKRTQTLVALAHPMEFTFHRAFDEVKNPKKEIQQLMTMGVQRILTSGQKSKAIEGLELLKTLRELANDRIHIMPGSGITAENAKEFKAAGFSQIHASASSIKNQEDSIFSQPQSYSDPTKIKAILDAVH